MKTKSLLLILFLLLSAGAPAQGQEAAPSPSPEPALTPLPVPSPSFREQTEPGPEVSRAPLHLTLEEAINVTLQRNRGIEDSIDNVTSSRYTLIAADADYEVKIAPAGSAAIEGGSGIETDDGESFGIQFSKKFATGTSIYITPKVIRTEEAYETGVTSYLVQPLLRGLSVEYNLSGIRAAEFGERTSLRSLYLTQVSTMVTTVQNIYNLIRDREILRLNEESARRLEGHKEAAQVKEKIGIASPIDVYRAEIELNQALENLTVAREAYGDSIDSLKLLLALPMETNLEITAPWDYKLLELDEKQAIEVALNNRVEIIQAEDDVSEAERSSRVAKQNTLPELNLELSYRRYGEDEKFYRSADFDKDKWGVGLSAEGDIWRTAEKAQYQQSLLTVKGTRRRMVNLRDEIQSEVKQELRTLMKSAKSIEIQKDQIHQAEGKLELARIKFSHGLANNFDLIEAERELLQAQSRLLGAVTNYIVSSYRLKAALGTLLEKPQEWRVS